MNDYTQYGERLILWNIFEKIGTRRQTNNSQTPIILIDDMRTFTYDNCGFSEKEILTALSEIDENYHFRKEDGINKNFLNDVLVAFIS